jgi:ATP-dependent Clp protease protease subunit
MKVDLHIARRNILARRIYVWDEIVEDTAGHFVERMDFLMSRSQDPVWVLIHTVGGSVTAAQTIVDEMQAVAREGVVVKTCVLGMAYSAGAFILGMGSPGERYVRPASTVMMHPVSFALSHDYADMQERATAFYKKEAEKMNRGLAEACGRGGKKFARFLKDIDKGLWLNAEEAIKYGVADKIWTGPLPLSSETNRETTGEQRGVREGIQGLEQSERLAEGPESVR